MNNCLWLFGLSGILYFLSKLFEETKQKYWGKNRSKERFYNSLECATGFISYAIFFITLIFAIYIYIFE